MQPNGSKLPERALSDEGLPTNGRDMLNGGSPDPSVTRSPDTSDTRPPVRPRTMSAARGPRSNRAEMRRRLSLSVMSDLMSENGDVSNGISSSHDIRREIERIGEEISSKYCKDSSCPVLLPPIPPLPPPSPSSDSNGSGSSTSVARHKAVVQVYQTLQDLEKENLVVLQGVQYTHLQYSLYVNHTCNKKENEVEGYCDFLVLGDGFVSLFDVRATPGTDQDDIFAEEHKLAQLQRTATLKLVRRCCIKTFRFKMPDILQFSVFVSVTKEEAQQLPSYVALSDKEKSCLIFKDELEHFTDWWNSRMPSGSANRDQEFDTALERVKQTLIGIWSVNDKNLSETCKCDLGYNVRMLCDKLGNQSTCELASLTASIRDQALKSGVENGFCFEDSSSDHIYHGPKPSLSIIVNRVPDDSSSSILRSVLNSELDKISELDGDCKVIITSDTAICIDATEGITCPVLNFQSDLNKKYHAVICVIDLSDILKLSTLRSQSYTEFTQVLDNLHSAVSSGRSNCSIILLLGVTEVCGDPGFEDFDSKTFNKKNRNYFTVTKDQIVSLVDTLASHSYSTWHDSQFSALRSDSSKIVTLTNQLYAFPDKQLNRDTLMRIADHTSDVTQSVARLSDTLSCHRSVTSLWGATGSCSNTALVTMQTQLGDMISDIASLAEVQVLLTSQLHELEELYGTMKAEVAESID